LKKSTAWPQLRLSWWIAIGVAAIVLTTTLLLLLVVDQFARNYAQRDAEVRLQQLAWQMRDALDQSMKERIVDIQDLSRSGPVRNFFENPVALRTILTQTQNQFRDYAWIGVADSSGKVVAGTQSMLEGRNATTRPWFIGGQKDLYVGEYRPAPLKPTLPFAVQPGFVDISLPIFDQKGLYKGVLGAHLSWAWARQIVNDLMNPANQRYSMDVLVVRDDGLVLLGPKDLENRKISTASLEQARKGQAGALVESWAGTGDSGHSGTRYITSYVRTGMWTGQAGLNWSILVRQPEHIALADILVLEKQMIVVAALECLLLMVCGVLVSYRLVAPMTALTTAIETQRTAADDYVPTGWSYYEFNRLSKAIGSLSKHTFDAPARDLEPRVNARVAELRDLVADLPPAPANRDRALFK
jgi:hypothetical protein